MKLLAAYLPGFPRTIVYMLQSSEYRAAPYIRWLYRTEDFGQVAKRRELVKTKSAKSLLLFLYLAISIHVLIGLVGLVWAVSNVSFVWIAFYVLWLVIYPAFWAHLIVLPLWLAEKTIIKSKQNRAIAEARAIFSNHQGIKIAIAGSYGKTSMKEILAAVLVQGKKVAATPGNQNVPRSHAKFAARLNGDEQIIIVEYGEEKPGDIKLFMSYTDPDVAIITGLAPNHLDYYKTLDNVARDLMDLRTLDSYKVFVNGDNAQLKQYAPDAQIYSEQGALGWKVANVKINADGTSFSLKKGKEEIKVNSALLGRHQIGPLTLAVVLAKELGITNEQIKKGLSAVQPIEHRMQPRVMGGAWIIDDTYNGNIEGMKAGLRLLAELKASGRKIYVTPGLVEQGAETERVHNELGREIAAANPDEVVLMQNSVTGFIEKGLREAGYSGHLTLQEDPLAFYTSIDQYIAAGDVLMMQNDWTDNYN